MNGTKPLGFGLVETVKGTDPRSSDKLMIMLQYIGRILTGHAKWPNKIIYAPAFGGFNLRLKTNTFGRKRRRRGCRIIKQHGRGWAKEEWDD